MNKSACYVSRCLDIYKIQSDNRKLINYHIYLWHRAERKPLTQTIFAKLWLIELKTTIYTWIYINVGKSQS